MPADGRMRKVRLCKGEEIGNDRVLACMHVLCVCDANSSATATCIMFSICKYDKRMVTVAELTPTASTNQSANTNTKPLQRAKVFATGLSKHG